MKTFATTHRAAEANRATAGGAAIAFAGGPSLHERSSAERTRIREILGGPRLQPKLAVGPPDDKYEREADRVAERVLRMPDPTLQRTCSCGGACDTCRERDEAALTLRREPEHGSTDAPAVAPPIVHEVLRSPGRPLDPETRAFFEPRFGRDFSDVRLHTGAKATESARAINAQAYTVGHRVVLAPHSNTATGMRLLAHELAHTIQQQGFTSNPSSRNDGGQLPDGSLIQRSVSYDECSDAEEGIVLASHNRAMRMVDNAIAKLDLYDGTSPVDVKTALDTHFHSNGAGLAKWIAFNLRILRWRSSSPQYECEKPQEGNFLGWSMWCVPWTDIELYPLWFSEPDIDVRASTMIHEWVHRYGCNFDLGYRWESDYSGHSTLRSLVNADPWAEFVFDVR